MSVWKKLGSRRGERGGGKEWMGVEDRRKGGEEREGEGRDRRGNGAGGEKSVEK